MDGQISNKGEIKSLVEDAESLLRDGRTDEARDIVVPLIPHIADYPEMIESERNRLKMRLYRILMNVPEFRFCEPETLDAMAAMQTIFRGAEQYTLAERLEAHVVYAHVKPDIPRGEEQNEFNALKTAKEILDHHLGDNKLDALAHHLICERSPFPEDKQKHMEDFFRIPFGDRGELLTTLCCIKIWPSVHIATDDKYIEQALTEVTQPPLQARLFFAKMQSILCRLICCTKLSERLDWLEEYEGQMESLMVNIQQIPSTQHLVAHAHFLFALRFACFEESNSAYVHMQLGQEIGSHVAGEDFVKESSLIEGTVEQILDDIYNEDDEDDEDAGDEWKKGTEHDKGDWLMGEEE